MNRVFILISYLTNFIRIKHMTRLYLYFILILFSISDLSSQILDETFKTKVKVPTNFDELWKDYDPRKEPLETEILYKCVEDSVLLQVVRYRIGVFKGKKAMMAAIYGYPLGCKKIPGLLQIHGGGQYADYRSVVTNAKRGYATISIAWAGRINCPGYIVNTDGVRVYWENKTDDPLYKKTTDWGNVDAYHAPSKYPETDFLSLAPHDWTIDKRDSPYNNSWFLCAVAARRALTFLEKQPEIDANKLGVYGHSMGGKITVMTATDSRVKVAVPSCGGISDLRNKSSLFLRTLSDSIYLRQIKCPILFLNPSNDFHASLEEVPDAINLIQSTKWNVTTSAHHNHQDHGEYEVSGLLWIDQHLKNSFLYPKPIKYRLNLDNRKRVPLFQFKIDQTREIEQVEVYYTQDGNTEDSILDYDTRINRYWHYVKPIFKNDHWEAYLHVNSTDKPLFVYANVTYKLDEEVEGAGYYYRLYKTKRFNVSSLVQKVSSSDLKKNKIKCSLKSSLVIESFDGDWEKNWFRYDLMNWDITTHKFFDKRWKPLKMLQLKVSVRSEKMNKFFVIINEKFVCELKLKGGNRWEDFILDLSDFKNDLGEILKDWDQIKSFELSISKYGNKWCGEKPEFRNLRWIKTLK